MPDFPLQEALPLAESPRLAQLLAPVRATPDDAAVLDAFWAQIAAQGTPLIEPLPADSPHAADSVIVTFLWRATAPTQQVLLIIDTLTDQYRRDDLTRCLMAHVEGTDIWHISYQLRADLRAAYHFHPVSPEQQPLSVAAKSREEWLYILTHTHADSFNEQTFPSRRGGEALSVLELPQAPAHLWWQARPETPAGTLTAHRFTSELLGNTRDVWVYLPADYTPTHVPYPVLVLLDGQAWVQIGSIQATLDNLIAEGAIPPMIACAIDSLDHEVRAAELTCNPRFIQALDEELLPWVKQQWAISDDPARTLIVGQSYGGLAAAFAGFHAPHRFGNVISQSGSFWWKEDEPTHPDSEWLVRQIAQAERRDVQFYVSVGWQEWMLLTPNRHLRDVLQAKDYPLIYREYNGGHDYVCWRGEIADGLIRLTQGWIKPIVAEPAELRLVSLTGRTTIPPQKPKTSPPQVAESPRILALQAAIAHGDPNALAAFWAQVEAEGTPLFEPIDGDTDEIIVTFLWRDASATLGEVVIIANKFTDASVFDVSVMEPLPNTDVWHRSYRVRADWRASYALAPIAKDADLTLGAYVQNMVSRAQSVGLRTPREVLVKWWGGMERAIPDPLNPRAFRGHSMVECPQAPPQPWRIRREDVPQGTVTEHQVKSAILENERRVWVYTPADYTPSARPYDVLLLLDGQSWMDDHADPASDGYRAIITTLDNLIASGQIPPLVVVMPEALDFMAREREMAGHLPFIHFLTQELMPWAADQWHITADPARSIISGLSLGGLTASFAGLVASQRFGNVLAQSGSFWWANGALFGQDEEWITQQYAQLPKQPVRLYIEVGLEEWVLVAPTRHFAHVLQARGYEVIYSEFNGGHDHVCFRGSIAEGLIALTQRW